MTSTLHRILISLAMTCVVACCGSRKPGAPTIRYLPAETQPCLTIPPPVRPALSCDQETSCDERIDTARLLDYLAQLDRWSRLYAWEVCRAR